MRKSFVCIIAALAAFISISPILASCSKDNGNCEPEISAGCVRHIILWTLSEDLSKDGKLNVIQYAEEAMDKFVKEIDGLIRAEVIYKKRMDSSTCDFMFDMYFTDKQALEAFSVNPEHLAVVARLKPDIAGRVCLDVEL